jgi:hypothetical protein
MIFNWSSGNLWSSTQYWLLWLLLKFMSFLFPSICVTLELIFHLSITFHFSTPRKDKDFVDGWQWWLFEDEDHKTLYSIFSCILLTWMYSSSTSLIYSAIKLHFNTTKMLFSSSFSFFLNFLPHFRFFFLYFFEKFCWN